VRLPYQTIDKLDKHQVKALLEKYRQGTCSPTEINLIEDWLATVKNEHGGLIDDNFIESQLTITKGRIDDMISAGPAISQQRSFSWWSVAASLLIFVTVAAAIGILYLKKPADNQLAAIPKISRHISNGIVYIETQKGITDHILLPDGSLITLNALSRVHYPVKFINHKRPVYLDEGEALFDVAKDKTSPFTVYTKKFATTALGTAFNIRSYANEHKESISLIHGKIRVDDLQPAAHADASKILLPHQQIVLNKISGSLIKTDFKDETPITAWKDGVLVFNDATVDEVINSVQNRFNVTIKNNSSRISWSYTGTFTDESLIDVLKTVCLTEGLTYTINKNNIVLN